MLSNFNHLIVSHLTYLNRFLPRCRWLKTLSCIEINSCHIKTVWSNYRRADSTEFPCNLPTVQFLIACGMHKRSKSGRWNLSTQKHTAKSGQWEVWEPGYKVHHKNNDLLANLLALPASSGWSIVLRLPFLSACTCRGSRIIERSRTSSSL